MWIEEEEWIEEEKRIMDIERGFPKLEILRLTMYSLENSKSSGVVLSRCMGYGLPFYFLIFL